MGLLRVFPAMVGSAAVIATVATMALDLLFAHKFWLSTSPAKILAVVACVAEAIVLALVFTKLFKYFRGTNGCHSINRCGTWFASDLIAIILATVASIALLIVVGKAKDLPDNKSTLSTVDATIGSSIALGLAFVGQLLFVVVYFVLHRKPDSKQAHSRNTSEEVKVSLQFPSRVKAVPYKRTKPALSQVRLKEWTPSEYSSRPGTSGGRSAADTVTSFSGSMSSFAFPLGSKTRLLSQSSKSGWRQGSLDSNAYRERTSVTEDGFESWDTSSVDLSSRQMALETSSPTRARFLEPIPASPVTSRSPSPGCTLDLESPRPVPRERCYSPVPRTPMSAEFELNIHPLFRSDSPGPPPMATPGTMVTAAPNAGQYITGMSVNQMRIGNFQIPQSPLSRRGSLESFRKPQTPQNDRL